MFKSLTQTKLPPVINKIVVVIALCGMFIGLLVMIQNDFSLPEALLYAAVLGLLFGAGAKYIIVKFMRAWMEGKLELAQREKEEAKKKADELKTQEREAANEAKNRIVG